MGLLKRQREIVIGTVLGDAYLQKTGKRNARLRLEHSERQRSYIWWKYTELRNIMQDRPKLIERYNPIFRKTYRYWRCQSHSMPILGKFRRWFYPDGEKRIPENIQNILRSPLTLAVWYMDNGCYLARDRTSLIYLPRYPEEDIQRLCQALEVNFDLKASLKIKKERYPCLYFPVGETRKLMEWIAPHVIESMRYKLPPSPRND